MSWSELYGQEALPSFDAVRAFVKNDLLDALVAHLQDTYGVLPQTQYSACSMQRGWNMKFKKSGRALCTIYPMEGYFIALVVMGTAQFVHADLLMPTLTPYVQELYRKANPCNGSVWLMIEVTEQARLDDVKQLVALRQRPKKA